MCWKKMGQNDDYNENNVGSDVIWGDGSRGDSAIAMVLSVVKVHNHHQVQQERAAGVKGMEENIKGANLTGKKIRNVSGQKDTATLHLKKMWAVTVFYMFVSMSALVCVVSMLKKLGIVYMYPGAEASLWLYRWWSLTGSSIFRDASFFPIFLRRYHSLHT